MSNLPSRHGVEKCLFQRISERIDSLDQDAGFIAGAPYRFQDVVSFAVDPQFPRSDALRLDASCSQGVSQQWCIGYGADPKTSPQGTLEVFQGVDQPDLASYQDHDSLAYALDIVQDVGR